MRIWVCFKVQPAFEQVLESDWMAFTLNTDIGYVDHSFNYFDESALELALRLREQLEQAGEPSSCHAVTVARRIPPALRKHLFALGFEDIIQIDATTEFMPRQTAALLADQLKTQRCDLILTGKQAGFADAGTVPYHLAAQLAVPVCSHIEELYFNHGQLQLIQADAQARRQLSVNLPLLCVIGNSPVTTLRAATLRDQLAASRRDVTLVQPTAEVESSPAPSLTRMQRTRQAQMLPADEPAQAAALLLNLIGKEQHGCAWD